jgi:hypothetical protein
MGVICGYGMISRNLVAYATFNNSSVIWWRSVLLLEEIEVPGENHRHVASLDIYDFNNTIRESYMRHIMLTRRTINNK